MNVEDGIRNGWLYWNMLASIIDNTNYVFENESDIIRTVIEKGIKGETINDTDKSRFENVARQVFSPIFDDDFFGTVITWFNVWMRNKGRIFYIGERSEIIEKYNAPGWKKYSTSLSRISYTKNKNDSAFLLFSNRYENGYGEVSRTFIDNIRNDYRLSNHLITIDMSEVDIGGKSDIDPSNIEKFQFQGFLSISEIVEKRECNDYLNSLHEYFAKKSKYNNDNKLVRQGVLLANYFRWVRASYGHDWKYLLYIPSINSKKFNQIPFGINIGLKDIRNAVNDILFLISAVSTFFTRLSIDWYEAEAEYRVQKELESKAEAAIMARNLSHNIGSHVLSSPTLIPSIRVLERLTPSETEARENINATKLEAFEAGVRLSRFNSYVQGRLDFIARSISGGEDMAEPMYFIKELMEPLFMQSVLLDNLLSDLGYSADKIAFHITIEDAETLEYSWDTDRRFFILQNDTPARDVLVGIPGGTTGAHAFYGFLENVMRNAAKYGEKADKFHLHLSLQQCRYGDHAHENGETRPANGAWVVSIWDNLSDGSQCCEKIRKLIKQPLISTGGSRNPEGHGIQEMRLCAQYLAGGHRFPPDKGYVKKGAYCAPCAQNVDNRKGCLPTDYYCKGITKTSQSMDGYYPLRCHAHAVGERDGNHPNTTLRYDLIMPSVTLLGVVDPKGSHEHRDDFVASYLSIKDMANHNPQLGLLLDDGESSPDKYLKEIAKYHYCLPFRFMVVVKDENRFESYKNQIESFPVLSPKITNSPDGWLPKDRIRIVHDEELMQWVKDPENSKFLGCLGTEAAILRAYDAWLRAFKEPPGGSKKWHLFIGFDHGGDRIIEHWRGAEVFNQADANATIAISVYATDGGESISAGNSIPNEAVIAYDNHGKALEKVDYYRVDSCAFYQEFGLSRGLTLYQSLSNPPQSPFGIAYFLYSLVEAALTKVYILDERFVGSLKLDNAPPSIGSSGKIKAAEKCGILPVYGVKDKEMEQPITSILSAPGSHYRLLDVSDFRMRDVQLGNDPDPDILVVHEGVLDILATTDSKVKWNKEELPWRLFNVAPHVVRCSGRGIESRQLDDRISFVEFSHISANTYMEMNKYALIKGLMGSSGNCISEESKDV